MSTSPAHLLRKLPLLLGLLLVLTASCSNDDPDLVADLLPINPGGSVSLAAQVQPIFTFSCAVSGCHDAGTAESGMILESGRLFDPGTGIVGVASQESALLRIAPFDSGNSYLLHKLLGIQAATGAGDTMPLGEPPLSDAQIQMIIDWVDQGAQDN